MILIISTSKESLHYLEFVKPVEDVLKQNKIDFETKYYFNITDEDLQKSDKIIICGTSLRDNEFIKGINKFSWIKKTDKSVLGICAGMQIISLIFGGKLKNKTEIGFYREKFKKDFLSLFGEQEVYHLHNNCTTLPKDFVQFNDGKIPQAIKHKNREIYGVLFHPEVRNKKLILKFVKDNIHL